MPPFLIDFILQKMNLSISRTKNRLFLVGGAIFFLSLIALCIDQGTIPTKATDTKACTQKPVSLKTSSENKERIKADMADSAKKTWPCTIRNIEPITIYAPSDGKLTGLVPVNTRVKAGDRVATIINTINDKSVPQKKVPAKALMQQEIESIRNSICISEQDITNLRNDLEQLNHSYYEVQEAYADAWNDFYDGVITQKKFLAVKENLARITLQIRDMEAMLDGKYSHIDSGRLRVFRLEGQLSIPASMENETEVTVSASGYIQEHFYKNNDIIEGEATLLTILPSHILPIEVKGRLPFAYDGSRAELHIQGTEFNGTGTLKFLKYAENPSSGEQTVTAQIIFSMEPPFGDNNAGKQGVLTISGNKR